MFCLNECERVEMCSVASYDNQICTLMTGNLNINNQNAFDTSSSDSYLFIKETRGLIYFYFKIFLFLKMNFSIF